MKIAVIGCGTVGGALARRLIKAAHAVLMSIKFQKSAC
ncbi:MAG: NAD(P)-binding domain-containing protein [Bacteroidia bacterium]|nr:NAD(P)-binding domain-containing protein [Bacteroidia bacterium]